MGRNKWVNEQFRKQMEAEADRRKEDELEEKLFIVMEVLEYPAKWTLEGMELVEIYAHPVLDCSYRVKKIVYRKEKYNLENDLPDPLLESYNKLMREIELASGVSEKGRGRDKKDRKKYVRVTEEMKAELIRLYHEGVQRRDIATYLGISIYSVDTYINKHRQEVQVHYDKAY